MLDAGIARLALGREELLANGGIDAIAGDSPHGPRTDERLAPPRPVRETSRWTPGVILFDTETMPARQQPVAAGRARDEGLQQKPFCRSPR